MMIVSLVNMFDQSRCPFCALYEYFVQPYTLELPLLLTSMVGGLTIL